MKSKEEILKINDNMINSIQKELYEIDKRIDYDFLTAFRNSEIEEKYEFIYKLTFLNGFKKYIIENSMKKDAPSKYIDYQIERITNILLTGEIYFYYTRNAYNRSQELEVKASRWLLDYFKKLLID